MKVNYNAWHTALQVPPIPLITEKDEVDTQEKGSYLTVELRYTPADDDSKVYKKNIRYFKTGTPKQYIEFRADIKKVITGQAITTGPAQFAMVRTLLRGDALRVFNNKASKLADEEPASLVLSMNELGKHVFPVRALAKQKRYMRRFIRKPLLLKAREFLACLTEMNDDLEFFPPYAVSQKLAADEMLEIVEFSLPVKWQKKMVEHDFDCSGKTIDDIIDFAERQETIEAFEADPPAKKAKKAPEQAAQYKTKGGLTDRAKSSAEARRHASKNSNHGQKPVCRLHGPGHWTNDCKVMLDQADRMKATRQAQHPSTYDKPKGKRPYGNNYSKEEVNKIVNAATKKFLTKQKVSNKVSDKDSDTDAELNHFNELELSDIDSDDDYCKL
jgi:hypothetical protein